MKIGDKVRIVKLINRGAGLSKTQIGFVDCTIVAINKNFITVQYKNYREAFNFADMINPRNRLLQLRKDKEWQNVTVEDINNTVGLQHLVRKKNLLIKKQCITDYLKEVEFEGLKEMKYKKSKDLCR